MQHLLGGVLRRLQRRDPIEAVGVRAVQAHDLARRLDAPEVRRRVVAERREPAVSLLVLQRRGVEVQPRVGDVVLAVGAQRVLQVADAHVVADDREIVAAELAAGEPQIARRRRPAPWSGRSARRPRAAARAGARSAPCRRRAPRAAASARCAARRPDRPSSAAGCGRSRRVSASARRRLRAAGRRRRRDARRSRAGRSPRACRARRPPSARRPRRARGSALSAPRTRARRPATWRR